MNQRTRSCIGSRIEEDKIVTLAGGRLCHGKGVVLDVQSGLRVDWIWIAVPTFQFGKITGIHDKKVDSWRVWLYSNIQCVLRSYCHRDGWVVWYSDSDKGWMIVGHLGTGKSRISSERTQWLRVVNQKPSQQDDKKTYYQECYFQTNYLERWNATILAAFEFNCSSELLCSLRQDVTMSPFNSDISRP